VCHLVKPAHVPRAALCPCSTSHQTTLPTSRSSPYGSIFPFLLERESKPGRSSFPKKSKPAQNRNWILKRNLKDLLLNFKDQIVLKIDLNLQIHLFLIPSFDFYKRFKSLFQLDQKSFKSKSWKFRKILKHFLRCLAQSLALAQSVSSL
jgi:hypothetical protein